MAARKPKTTAERAPRLIVDAVDFWRAQYNQAKRDADSARVKPAGKGKKEDGSGGEAPPTILANLVRLEREAWREYKAALSAAEASTPEVLAAAAGGSPDTSLEGEFLTAQRMQRDAQAAGSHVAARQLFCDVRAIAAKIRARDEAAEAAELAGVDVSVVVEMVCTVASSLPPALKARLLEALAGP